jgi:Tfp pilus assembly protein PilV
MYEQLSKKQRLMKKRLGFTITEVVVASGLLLVAMVPILKALTTAYVTSSAIERKTRSLILAQNKLDEIEIKSIHGYFGTFTQANTSLGASYVCNVSDTAVSSNLRKVAVSVGYDDSGNSALGADEVEITLSTYISRRK